MTRRTRTNVHSKTRLAPAGPSRPGTPDTVLEFIRVMWAVDHELQRVSRRMVSRMGLTAPQRLAVRFIGRHPGVTLGMLAELLHLHPGTVTGIVRHLEEAGLAARTRSTWSPSAKYGEWSVVGRGRWKPPSVGWRTR